jgi:hypothetical protein
VGNTTLLPQRFSVSYESVIAFGKVMEIFEGEKQAALETIISKYSPAFTKEGLAYIKSSSGDTRIFKIEIEHLTGKANK